MELYILLLFESLMVLQTTESPYNHINNHHFVRNSEYNFRQENSSYNEVKPIIPRNHRHEFNVDGENVQSSRNNENTNDFSWGNSNSEPLRPPVPVAATLELPGTQKFSNLPSSINNTSISITDDRILFPDDKRDFLNGFNFTKEEIACFAESKVFFRGSCEELKFKGSCREGEWLILDLKAVQRTPPKILPKCSKRNCNSTDFFWPQTKKCYRYNDTAVISRICPPGNTIDEDYYGYGKCKCQELHVLHSNGTCYPLYTQGPCSKGYLFVEIKNKGECIKNPCINSSLVLYDNDPKKLCYELGKQGPCKPNFLFKVSKTSKKPECVDKVALLAAINPPPACVTDAKGQCKKEFKVDKSGYVDKIIADAHKRKTNT